MTDLSCKLQKHKTPNFITLELKIHHFRAKKMTAAHRKKNTALTHGIAFIIPSFHPTVLSLVHHPYNLSNMSWDEYFAWQTPVY